MKTKSSLSKAAALTCLVAAWIALLGWGTAAVHAAEDSPAQTAARNALRQKMQQADTATNQTTSTSPAFSAAAPVLTVQPKKILAETDTWAAAVSPVTTIVQLAPRPAVARRFGFVPGPECRLATTHAGQAHPKISR